MDAATTRNDVVPSVVASPDAYVWDAPSAQIRVVINWQAAERIRLELMRSAAHAKGGTETGGILLGRAVVDGQRVIRVEEFEPVNWSYSLSVEQKRAFEATLARLKGASGRTVVGYYRSHSRDELFLNAGDLVLIKSYFPDLANIFLLVKPSGQDRLLTRFFFWHNGLIQSEATDPQYPFGRPQESAQPPALVLAPKADAVVQPAAERVPEAPRQPPPALLPALPPPPAPTPPPAYAKERKPISRWAKAAVFGVLALAAAGSLVVYFGPKLHWANWSRPAAGPAAGGQLSLQIDKKLSDLVLTWNRNAPPIQNARRAILSIQDGTIQRSYPMDLGQLRTGSVFYTPLSGDIQFRLDVYDEADRPVTESIRVLSAALYTAPVPLPNAPNTPDTNPLAGVPPIIVGGPAPGEASRLAANPPGSDAAKPAATRQRTIYFNFTPPPPRGVVNASIDAPPALDVNRTTAASTIAPVLAANPPSAVPPPVRTPPPAPVPTTPPPQPVRLRISSYTPPKVVREVYPDVPQNIKSMIMGRVELEVVVQIDDKGKVTNAALTGGRGPLTGFLADSAIMAAKAWRFQPARDNTGPVPSSMVLKFRFLR